MLSTKQFLSVVLLGSLLSVTIKARPPKSGFVCTEPPLGTWIVEDYVQVEPGVYTNNIFSHLVFERAFANVFTGRMNVTDRRGEIGGFLWFTGFFDLDTCVMTGSIFRHDMNLTDTFKWTYNGNTFDGDYVGCINGELFAPLVSRNHVTYQG